MHSQSRDHSTSSFHTTDNIQQDSNIKAFPQAFSQYSTRGMTFPGDRIHHQSGSPSVPSFSNNAYPRCAGPAACGSSREARHHSYRRKNMWLYKTGHPPFRETSKGKKKDARILSTSSSSSPTGTLPLILRPVFESRRMPA